MPMEDGFDPDHALGVGKARDRAAISLRVLTAGMVVAAATALGIAVLSAGDLSARFADVTAAFTDVTASLVDKSTAWFATDRSASPIQSSDAQASSLPAKEGPARNEIATVAGPAGQSQTENSEPASGALFGQFQAWATEKDLQAQVEAAQPIQEAPAPVVKNAPAQVAEKAEAPPRPAQKHRHIRPFPNARAEMRAVHNPRKKVRREQSARIPDPPAQDARAQDARAQEQSGQTVQPPSFLQTFGVRN